MKDYLLFYLFTTDYLNMEYMYVIQRGQIDVWSLFLKVL